MSYTRAGAFPDPQFGETHNISLSEGNRFLIFIAFLDSPLKRPMGIYLLLSLFLLTGFMTFMYPGYARTMQFLPV